MKRNKTKLELKTQTVRTLSAEDFRRVVGGTSAFACGPDTFDPQTDRYVITPKRP